jgi:hypothetical protein
VLWQVRGWLDKFVGGPGLRRGRRHPEMVEFGEALDFWRVVGIDRDKSLSLRAEMKLPGDAQLDFAIEEIDAQSKPPLTRLVMTARFRPSGLLGIFYWYAVVPLHEFVFGGMLRGIQKTAEAMEMTSKLQSKQTECEDLKRRLANASVAFSGVTGKALPSMPPLQLQQQLQQLLLLLLLYYYKPHAHIRYHQLNTTQTH